MYFVVTHPGDELSVIRIPPSPPPTEISEPRREQHAVLLSRELTRTHEYYNNNTIICEDIMTVLLFGTGILCGLGCVASFVFVVIEFFM